MALVDIDEVIRLIRSSENSAQAKERLIERFSLSDVQTQYILDTPLRRSPSSTAWSWRASGTG